MSTDLVASAASTHQGSAAITNVERPPMAPVQLVAANAEEMADAQRGLATWFEAKLAQCRRDQADAESNLTTARASGFKSESFSRAMTKARKQTEFYEKCLAAVNAGYVIIPDLPVDVFAIRTTRLLPAGKAHRSTYESNLSAFIQSSNVPAIGEGEYVDRFPLRSVWAESYEEKGETKKRYVAEPLQFAEVDFPVALATPAVMEATRAAMARNLFDEIGGLPARREKGDPIIVGRIIKPNQETGPNRRGITFLIAWWVDTRQL